MADSVRTQRETAPPGATEVSQNGGRRSNRRPGAPRQETAESFDRNGLEQELHDTPILPTKPRHLFASGDTANTSLPKALAGDGEGTGRYNRCRGTPSHHPGGDDSSSGGGFTRRTSRLSGGEEGRTLKGMSRATDVARGKTPSTPTTRPSGDRTHESDGSLEDENEYDDGGAGDGGGVGDCSPADLTSTLGFRARMELAQALHAKSVSEEEVHLRSPSPKPAAVDKQRSWETQKHEEKEDESQELDDLHGRIEDLEILLETEASQRYDADCRAENLEAELRDLADRYDQEVAARAGAEANLSRYMELFQEARAAWQNTQGMVEKKERELAAADVKIDGEASDSSSLQRRLKDAKKGKELCRQQSLALKLALEGSPVRDGSPDGFSPGKNTVRFSEETLDRDGGRTASAVSGGKGEAGVAGGVTGGSVLSMPESSSGEDGERAAAEARWEAGIAATAAVATESFKEISAVSLQQQRAQSNHGDETEQQQQQQRLRVSMDQLQQQAEKEQNAPPEDRNGASPAPLGPTTLTSASTRTTQLSPSAPSFFPPSMTVAVPKPPSKEQLQGAKCEQQDSSSAVLCAGFEKIALTAGTRRGDDGDGGAGAERLSAPLESRSDVESSQEEQGRGTGYGRFASSRNVAGGAGGTEEGEDDEGVIRRAMAFLEALGRPQGEETMATLKVGRSSAVAATSSIMSGENFLELHKTQEGLGELLTTLGATGLAF